LELQTEKQLYVACCIDCGMPIHESDKANGRCYCGPCHKSWWVVIGGGKVIVSEDDPEKARKSVLVNGVRHMRPYSRSKAS
jgi:uncharacterized Zn finger protein (UPF0148 family)